MTQSFCRKVACIGHTWELDIEQLGKLEKFVHQTLNQSAYWIWWSLGAFVLLNLASLTAWDSFIFEH